MKLSEAIRVGAKLHPQGFGDMNQSVDVVERVGWFRKRVKQERRTCAWGAAIEAQGCKSRKAKQGDPHSGTSLRGTTEAGEAVTVIDIPNDWPALLRVDCPQCNDFEEHPTLIRLMAHLNDDHRWTREQVAVFVERIERAQEPVKPLLPLSENTNNTGRTTSTRESPQQEADILDASELEV